MLSGYNSCCHNIGTSSPGHLLPPPQLVLSSGQASVGRWRIHALSHSEKPLDEEVYRTKEDIVVVTVQERMTAVSRFPR